MLVFILSLSSFVLAWGVTGWLIGYFSQELLDIPNQRSSHQQPVPRGGGLGFIAAFVITGAIATVISRYDFSFLSSTPTLSAHFGQICLIVLPLTIVGLIDDRQDVPAAIRYLVQLTAAGLAIIFWGTIPLLPRLEIWGLLGTIIPIIISAIAITANINFYNFMDGLDGLVASVTAIQVAFIAFYLQQPIFLLLTAALAGFIYWNWSPAKIFMGDVGSTVLGAMVAISLLGGNQNPTLTWSAFTVILPLVGDAIYTLLRRLLNQENIFQAHRTHIYQRLQQLGWSHAKVATSYMVITAISALVVTYLGVLSLGINLIFVILAICIAEWYLKNRSWRSNQTES